MLSHSMQSARIKMRPMTIYCILIIYFIYIHCWTSIVWFEEGNISQINEVDIGLQQAYS